MRVYVQGMSSLSVLGPSALGLSERLAAGNKPQSLRVCDDDLGFARERKMMSRAALLAAASVRGLAERIPPAHRAGAAFYCGVGASGGALDDVLAILRESFAGDEFSLQRFGSRGLAACNPLLAFQLMNNFTLCHAAIALGTQGANGAFFSRGSGSFHALAEALHAIRSQRATWAIAGAADSALHEVTQSELRRLYSSADLPPSEGAGFLALSSVSDSALCEIDLATVAPEFTTALPREADDGWVVGAADSSTRAALLSMAKSGSRGVTVELSPFGECLAATPALAWLVAVDLVVRKLAPRVWVACADVDGELGIARFCRSEVTA